MAEIPLAIKLKLKPNQQAALVGAPEGYLARLGPLPEGVIVSNVLEGTYDWIQIFVTTKAGLDGLLPGVVAALKPESLLWISFPKGSSGMQTDLTRDRGWEAVRETGLRWINLISIDEGWSAFSLRPSRPGEAPQPLR